MVNKGWTGKNKYLKDYYYSNRDKSTDERILEEKSLKEFSMLEEFNVDKIQEQLNKDIKEIIKKRNV